MKVYGADICIDCRDYKAIQKARGFAAEYIDITENTVNLKEFLEMRDNDPVFDEVKAHGGIGIPLFVKEDGTKTFDIDEALSWIGQEPVNDAVLFVEYPKCTTCQKAKKWLDANGVEYTDRHIKDNNPTADELKEWHKKSGLPLKKFFNTSGLLYKEMQLKDKIPTMTEEEQYELLASDGMLVKRPIVVKENQVLVGFKEAEWEEKLK